MSGGLGVTVVEQKKKGEKSFLKMIYSISPKHQNIESYSPKPCSLMDTMVKIVSLSKDVENLSSTVF